MKCNAFNFNIQNDKRFHSRLHVVFNKFKGVFRDYKSNFRGRELQQIAILYIELSKETFVLFFYLYNLTILQRAVVGVRGTNLKLILKFRFEYTVVVFPSFRVPIHGLDLVIFLSIVMLSRLKGTCAE